MFYRDTIGTLGNNLDISTRLKSHTNRNLAESSRSRRHIPEKVLIGYASHKLEAVRTAIKQGANVIMWSFVDFRASYEYPYAWTESSRRVLGPRVKNVVPDTTLDLQAIKAFIHELDLEGHTDVLHLIAVGGWNGRHLDPLVKATEWYEAFDSYLGDIFDGIDWDLEGNDDMLSVYNTFTFECLDKMGEISRMAHEGKLSWSGIVFRLFKGYLINLQMATSYQWRHHNPI